MYSNHEDPEASFNATFRPPNDSQVTQQNDSLDET